LVMTILSKNIIEYFSTIFLVSIIPFFHYFIGFIVSFYTCSLRRNVQYLILGIVLFLLHAHFLLFLLW
jgi:hypothetical protein